MSNSILIINTPKKCGECKFWFAKATDPVKYRCMAQQKYIDDLGSKPDWCPLQELPVDIPEIAVSHYMDRFTEVR